MRLNMVNSLGVPGSDETASDSDAPASPRPDGPKPPSTAAIGNPAFTVPPSVQTTSPAYPVLQALAAGQSPSQYSQRPSPSPVPSLPPVPSPTVPPMSSSADEAPYPVSMVPQAPPPEPGRPSLHEVLQWALLNRSNPQSRYPF